MSMRHVTLIRDISAMALALPLLEPHEIEQVGGEAPFIDRPKIVMSFGHFLEAATIIPVDDGWMALAGAAGEMSLGGVDAEEIELLKHAGADGPMSAGNLLSSEALQRLYLHLLSRKGRVAEGDPHDSLATGLRPVLHRAQTLEREVGTAHSRVALETVPALVIAVSPVELGGEGLRHRPTCPDSRVPCAV